MTGNVAWNRKASTEAIVAAYRETGTVWKAALKLGLAGQSVHERLRAIDYPMARRTWTAEETAELGRLMANGLTISDVAHQLGRTYAGVACRASRTSNPSTRERPRKIPRGVGYDKVSVARHLKALEASGAKVTLYARANGLEVNLLVLALQRHFADRWQSYLATHSPLPAKVCEYCEVTFVPANGKQRFCTRACGSRANTDRDYFGGNRRNTVGLAEGVCQLCGRTDAKGLSSHHVLGKENDPGNYELVALCAGCHQVVSHLGGRAFVDDPRAWEALIALAWTRRHGPEIHADPKPKVVYTEVRIEVWEDDEDDDIEEVS